MQSPVQIRYHGLPPSEALSAAIERRVEHLERLFGNITDCRVVVELAQHRHRKGNAYNVIIELHVPGDRLVVSRDPGDDPTHTDAYVAVRDAFDALDRRLQDYIRRLRNEVKSHTEPWTEGRVVRLEPGGDHGFIATADGREVYFHENAVIGAELDDLREGDLVRFCEEAGQEGPQATTVYWRRRDVARHPPAQHGFP